MKALTKKLSTKRHIRMVSITTGLLLGIFVVSIPTANALWPIFKPPATTSSPTSSSSWPTFKPPSNTSSPTPPTAEPTPSSEPPADTSSPFPSGSNSTTPSSEPSADTPTTPPPVEKQPPTNTELFEEVNRIRTENNVPSLAISNALSTSAERKCTDMVQYGYYGHKNPQTGQRGLDIIKEELHASTYIAENLNFGSVKDAQGFFESWMASSGHRTNILNSRYTHTGFAVCTASHVNDRIMLVEHFAAL